MWHTVDLQHCYCREVEQSLEIFINQFTTYSIPTGSDLAELIREIKLIILDEAPMMSKHCFETLDRTMCDKPFGGKIIVFSDDFKHILLVITDGGIVETVLATLNYSFIWATVKF